jgi:hypothetical protein
MGFDAGKPRRLSDNLDKQNVAEASRTGNQADDSVGLTGSRSSANCARLPDPDRPTYPFCRARSTESRVC